MTRPRPRPWSRRTVLLAPLALLGCSLPGAGVAPSGELRLLFAPFRLDRPPQFWIRRGPVDGFDWRDRDGVIALELRAGRGGGLLARRTNALIAASPYLSFIWRSEDGGPLPAELWLGFRQRDLDDWGESDFGLGLPPFDRLLRIRPEAPDGPTDGWRENTLDLTALHRRSWPQDDPLRARLVLIALNIDAAGAQRTGHIARLYLSR